MANMPANIPAAPAALVGELTKTIVKISPANSNYPPVGFMREGTRNETLASIAGTARRKGASQHEIATILHAINRNSGNPIADEEVEQVATSIARYEPASEEVAFDDVPLSREVAQRLSAKFCATTSNGWMYFDGKKWKCDGASARVQEAVKNLLQDFYRTVVASGDVERIKNAKSLLTASRVKRIIDLIASAPEIVGDMEEFDQAGPLLNLQNGVLDLNTLELREHDPELRLTKLAGVAFDPEAKCPTFDRFLDEIMPKEMQSFVMRLFGYALVGQPDRQIFTIFHGVGSNGKSTLVDIVQHVFGDYARSAEPSTFIKQKNERVRDDLARLRGARMVATSELATGEILDAALVKRLTGGDTITARALYKDSFEFKPQFTLFMVTNALPVIDGGDAALARRLILVPFNAVIQDRDPRLSQRLREEVDGIFNRILKGLADYRQNGLNVPEVVRHAASSYAAASDLITAFLEDRCVLADELNVSASVLYEAYRCWCAGNGVKSLAQPTFRQEVTKRTAITSKRTNSGVVWPGLGLRPRQSSPFVI